MFLLLLSMSPNILNHKFWEQKTVIPLRAVELLLFSLKKIAEPPCGYAPLNELVDDDQYLQCTDPPS